MASIEHIHNSLTQLSIGSPVIPLDIKKDKWIIFSDHHRGTGDGADDFAICKTNYVAALCYYLENDYGLIILGDAEEFWENTLKSVITKYKDVLEIEKQFYEKDKLIKIWGNHDDAWNHLNKVKTYLFPFFNNIETHEAVNFCVLSGDNTIGNILLVHGHQGSGFSDRFAGISRWFVRVIWKNIQRWFKVPLSTPAKSKVLKDKHDIAMHSWAKAREKQIVICGHTHQPVFMSKNHIDVLELELALMDPEREDSAERINVIESKINNLKKKTTAIGTLVSDSKPCYFNSGCCSFSDGDITGIELAEGNISLIKWSLHKKHTIDTESIVDLFSEL